MKTSEALQNTLGASLSALALALSGFGLALSSQAANHREAPITAIDHKADITDVFAFRSYGANDIGTNAVPKVTFIMNVDPLLDSANGPTLFPFDPDLRYEIKIDNNHDAAEDIIFRFEFRNDVRGPGVFTVVAGAGNGINAPSNSPAPIAPGTPLIPPQIKGFNDAGLFLRQSYTVTLVRNGVETPLTGSAPFYAVPANAGPRTMDYTSLFNAGTYSLPNGIKVFAGTVDDPFWIDLGATFDTLNLRQAVNGGVLTSAQDAARENFAPDTVAGYSVNAIAIEVPVAMLTSTSRVEPANAPAATIGMWATTSRPRITVRVAPPPFGGSAFFTQIQRMGNPLINELLIGIGSKDRFSIDDPKNDAQFADFFLDPLLPRLLNAATNGAIPIPAPPRTDLLPLVTYAPPIAAQGTPAGPVADLLRLNTGVAPTPAAQQNRLGLLAGDPAGFPNGRRLGDDVTDIALRAVVGVLNPAFNRAPNNILGDGVNVNDFPYRTEFPYLADSPSGRDRRHIDPGEPGCTGGSGAACPR